MLAAGAKENGTMQLAHASGKRKAAATKAAAKRPTGAAQGRNPFAIASGAHTPESPAAAAASASPAPPGTQMDDDDEDDEAAEHALILAAQQAAREAAASKGSAAAPPAEPPVSVKDAPSAEAEPATASTGTATTNQQDAVQDGEPGKEADEENDDVPCTSTSAAPSVEQRVELGADDDDDDEDEDDEVAIRKAQERARAAAPPRCSDAGGGGSSPPEPIHPGMACDRSGQCPIVGFRYHLVGEDFDLCQAEYDKLPEEEQTRYEKIAGVVVPDADDVVMPSQAACGGGGGGGGPGLAPDELRACKAALKEIRKHKDAEPFLDPVDWKALDILDYPTIIKRPMDLGTVMQRLEANEYQSAHELSAEISLVWNNAMAYNPDDSWVYESAEGLKSFADKKLAPLMSGMMQPQAGRARRGAAVRAQQQIAMTLPTDQSQDILQSQAQAQAVRQQAMAADPDASGLADESSDEDDAPKSRSKRTNKPRSKRADRQSGDDDDADSGGDDKQRGKKKKKKADASFFMTPAEREAEAQRQQAEQERLAREARAAAEAEFARKQAGAHDEWLEERRRLREETAQLNAGRSICSIFSKPSKPAPSEGATASTAASGAEAPRAVGQAMDADSELSLAPAASGTTLPDAAWFEAWPWDAAGCAVHVGVAVPGAQTADTTAAASAAARRQVRPPPSPVDAGSVGDLIDTAQQAARELDAEAAEGEEASGRPSPKELKAVAEARSRWMSQVQHRHAEAQTTTASAADGASSADCEGGNVGWRSELWSEIFKPRKTAELCGNGSAASQLLGWLQQWIDAKKAKAGGGGKHGEADSECSDYECESSSGEDEDISDSVCNMIVLEGPSGIGKTAAVYACAAELGLKVLEVNPAMSRAGRHVLTSFGEATQSHELAKWSSLELAKQDGSQGGPAEGGGKKKKDAAAKKGGGKAAKAGKAETTAKPNLFFGAGRPAVDAKAKAKAEAEKAEAAKKAAAAAMAPELDTAIESSLVLFEEVDIVFDDDVGFYAALRKLARHSKCPIVLTCNALPAELRRDAALQRQCLSWSRPTMPTLVGYLSAVCAVCGVQMADRELHQLAEFHNCDLRQILHTIQCWGLMAAEPATPTDSTEAPTVTFERTLSLGNLSCAGALSRVLLRNPEDASGTPSTVARVEHQARVLTHLISQLQRSPLLEQPLRMVDAATGGRLLGKQLYAQLLEGRIPPADQGAYGTGPSMPSFADRAEEELEESLRAVRAMRAEQIEASIADDETPAVMGTDDAEGDEGTEGTRPKRLKPSKTRRVVDSDGEDAAEDDAEEPAQPEPPVPATEEEPMAVDLVGEGTALTSEADGEVADVPGTAAEDSGAVAMGATAELYEHMSCAHLFLEPPRVTCGPAGLRQPWDELPWCAAEARAGIGSVTQLLAMRSCQRVVLAESATPVDDEPCTPQCHLGMMCDRSGQCPIVGFRYHLAGEDFDLCQAEYNKLPEEEQARYEKIAPPTAAASEAETAGAMSTTGVTTSTRHPARSILRMPQDASLASTNAARSLMRGPLAPRVVRYSSAGPHHHFLLACRVRPMTAVALGRWNWRSSAEAASRAIARRTSSASARCGPFIGSKRLARYDLWPARTNARCSLAHPRSRLLSDRRSRSRGASSTTLRSSSRARTSGSSCAP